MSTPAVRMLGPGAVIGGGRYKIVRLIGQGGMGEVYEAEHTALRKRVAIKTLSSAIAFAPGARERFLREARAASGIRSNNVVDISDFGMDPDGLVYMVMELLEGTSLEDVLEAEGRLAWRRAVAIAVQVLSALSQAHALGIIHRDIKPANIVLSRASASREHVTVVDFGIAKVLSGDGTPHSLTSTGTLLGSPHYMSPEQCRGSAIDARSDVYSVGALLYELVTGQVPYDADTFVGILTRHITDPLPKPTSIAPDVDLPILLEDAIVRALEKDPGDRYQSALEFAEALAAAARTKSATGPTPAATAPTAPEARVAAEPIRTAPVAVAGAAEARRVAPTAGAGRALPRLSPEQRRGLAIGAGVTVAAVAVVAGLLKLLGPHSASPQDAPRETARVEQTLPAISPAAVSQSPQVEPGAAGAAVAREQPPGGGAVAPDASLAASQGDGATPQTGQADAASKAGPVAEAAGTDNPNPAAGGTSGGTNVADAPPQPQALPTCADVKSKATPKLQREFKALAASAGSSVTLYFGPEGQLSRATHLGLASEHLDAEIKQVLRSLRGPVGKKCGPMPIGKPKAG